MHTPCERIITYRALTGIGSFTVEGRVWFSNENAAHVFPSRDTSTWKMPLFQPESLSGAYTETEPMSSGFTRSTTHQGSVCRPVVNPDPAELSPSTAMELDKGHGTPALMNVCFPYAIFSRAVEGWDTHWYEVPR